MKITKSVTINAPIDHVWEVLGPNYERAGDWASAVYVSQPRTGTPKVKDAPVAGRVCETSLGPFTESIEVYDPVNYRLAYSATGAKMPGFMKGLVNEWRLKSVGANQTDARMELTADIAFPFNVLMGWVMKMQFNKALSDSIEDFKHYAETGKQHPRKQKVDTSKKAVAARQAMA